MSAIYSWCIREDSISGEDSLPFSSVCKLVHDHDDFTMLGIDNHQIINIPIITAGAVINTQHGEVMAIMNQFAYTGKGKTILSSAQLKWFKSDVNDKPMKVPGGLKCILTIEGYTIPLNIKAGLPYIMMHPYMDDEWDTLPHVILTSDDDWDPSILDNDIDDD